MKRLSNRGYIVLTVFFCAVVMSIVDGLIQPDYAVKSAVKAVLFLGVPASYFIIHREGLLDFKSLFIPKKRDALYALGLGALVYIVIVGGYFVLDGILDISAFGMQVMTGSGVSPDNFLAVALYIPLVNSFLEEFIFRGFAFITLKSHGSRWFACLFSAFAFAGYHFGMVFGSFHILTWVLPLQKQFCRS